LPSILKALNSIPSTTKREGRREGGKEGRREGGKEGRREGGKEGRKEGRKEKEFMTK
jgi:flagellar biosynthesis/type III secretory pathway protein FliH